jgi:hypothetical protein
MKQVGTCIEQVSTDLEQVGTCLEQVGTSFSKQAMQLKSENWKENFEQAYGTILQTDFKI